MVTAWLITGLIGALIFTYNIARDTDFYYMSMQDVLIDIVSVIFLIVLMSLLGILSLGGVIYELYKERK